ncbi:hypothetical protein GG344DRAFT_83018 [Lentinula edodes]|nr:hypothetical protein GG344DRAFT_83018 [Lentinula edodes]
MTTTTNSSTAGPLRSHPVPPLPADTLVHEEEGLEDEDEDKIIWRAQARVERLRARKAAEAARKKAEEEAARVAAEKKKKAQETQERANRAQQQEEEVVEWRRLLAAAATARSQRGTSPSEMLVLPRRPVIEIEVKGPLTKIRTTATTTKRNPANDAGRRRSLARCRLVREVPLSVNPAMMQKCGARTVKQEGGGNPSGKRLAVLESQVAQLLADNRQLRDGQVKANTYHRHFNRKLDWLVTDAARRRRTPPEVPEAGPSGLSKKQRRVMDSDEEEEQGKVEEKVGKEEDDGEGEEEEENKPAPKKARSEKGKEREE